MMNCPRFVLLLILSFALAAGTFAQISKRKGPIVRQVDRILIESGDPKALFNFFFADLQLPEAWPLAENQGYISGGVGVGNVTLELYRYTQRNDAPARKPAEAHFAGLALEPYPLADALRELKTAGIPFSSPEPYVSKLPDGSRGVLWTTVPLPSFSKSGTSIFLYEYSSAFLKVDVTRRQLGNRLILNNGGPLGIQSVREIVIASTDFEKEKAAWKLLLGGSNASGSWSLGDGPAIRLAQGTDNRIQKIIFQVKSLNQAKAFLKKKQLLGAVSANEVSLNPSQVQRLNISLAEQF
jgi:hypothetical protein